MHGDAHKPLVLRCPLTGVLLTLRSPTEPFCAVVRKVTPPLFGVDISPVRLDVCMRQAKDAQPEPASYVALTRTSLLRCQHRVCRGCASCGPLTAVVFLSFLCVSR
jgi:hypothetical protein